MTRTINAIKNTKYAMISRALIMLINFVSRTIFIRILGNAYLGINGLYTEILTALSFAELGFGTAMSYAMYAPVAQNDETSICRLLDFYKTIYRLVAMIIAFLGIAILPLLQYIVKGADNLSIIELRTYFLFFLANTVVSYFVSYKYSYINALQHNFRITNIDLVVSSIISASQIIILLLTTSFLAYLIIQTFLTCISRFPVYEW